MDPKNQGSPVGRVTGSSQECTSRVWSSGERGSRTGPREYTRGRVGGKVHTQVDCSDPSRRGSDPRPPGPWRYKVLRGESRTNPSFRTLTTPTPPTPLVTPVTPPTDGPGVELEPAQSVLVRNLLEPLQGVQLPHHPEPTSPVVDPPLPTYVVLPPKVFPEALHPLHPPGSTPLSSYRTQCTVLEGDGGDVQDWRNGNDTTRGVVRGRGRKSEPKVHGKPG